MSDVMKVSDVARLLRLSSDSIRFYEKRGIIHPKRQGDNQYRLFHMDDIRRLYDCKIFQNIGFTISEIEAIIHDKTRGEISGMLEERERQINSEILRAKMALHKIEKLRESAELADAMRGRYLIQASPHVKMCFYAENNHFEPDRVAHPSFRTIMEYHNLFDCAVVIPKKYAARADAHEKAIFGFSIDVDAMREWDVPMDDPQLEIASVTCVYSAFAADGIISAEDLAGAFAWMKRRNLRLSGDVFCKMRRVTFEHGADTRYYEVWLPVAEDERGGA